MMTLGELIEALEALHPGSVDYGFGNPHSYRGDYSDLAFEPQRGTTIVAMLEAATSAVGATFQGYKGGDFVMDEWTRVWLACEGTVGETIGPALLGFMVQGRPLNHEEFLPREQA